MLNIGDYITEVERYQADGNGYHNGYDKLEGDWALYYKIAQYFVHKVKREDRQDFLHDLMLEMAKVKTKYEAKGKLTPEELSLINRVREAYNKLIPIPCKGCRDCMPCPKGVAIPQILQIYNEMIMYNDLQGRQSQYNNPGILKKEQHADQCAECGECMEACPQKISIPEWLKKAHELLKLNQ